MADTTLEARREIADARRAAGEQLDKLGASARASLDIPAKVRRNPVRTVGLASGAAFLLVGGPRRVLRAAGARLLPQRPPRSLLPKEIQRTVNRLEPEQRELVKGHLERDFAAYLAHTHPQEPANARRSLWKTYDRLMGPVTGRAGRELVKRLFEPGSNAGESDAGDGGKS
jgi:hypothetical protein